MRSLSTVGSAQESDRQHLVDAAVLAAITILSALTYVWRVGFYSDDWSILAGFEASPWFPAMIGGGFSGRPVQAIYSALLYELFGLNPVGYHLVGTAMVAACAALLQLLLVRLGSGRSLAFAATLLFIMLPQLSTVRVWIASSQVPLSLAFMLVSMHCQLSYVSSGKPRWLASAIGAALLSVGAYEIFAPLLFGFAVALVFLNWRGPRDWRHVAAAGLVFGLLLLIFLYKVVFSGRAGPITDLHRYLLGLRQLVRLDYDWRIDSGLNVIATPRAYFLDPMLGWWSGAKALFSGQAGPPATAIAVVIALLTLWRLGRVEQRRRPIFLLLLGITAFLLGNATFLVVPAVAFTSTGLDNRVQVAAAIGVGMIFAALIGCAAAFAPSARGRRIAFAAAIALIGAAAFVRIDQIEGYWVKAPSLQRQVLGAARADLRSLPAHSTVILDGVCPYYGPAVVFETNWDIGGALTIVLGRPINGDAVSPRMSLTPAGLATSIYKVPTFYPYGSNLFVYDPARHRLVRLDSAAAAARYFASRQQHACPGYVARGAEV